MRTFPLLLRHTLFLSLSVLVALPAATAQPTEEPIVDPEPAPTVTVDAGVTLASRFIYRGINLGEAPQIQPSLSLNAGDFQLSLWSSHPIAQPSDESIESPRDANYREVLFWALYNIDVGVGTLTPYMQNHYNPNVGELFNFDGGGDGAHFLQAQLMFSGDERLPIDALIGWVFYNDPGDSIYLEGGYRFSVSGLDLRAFAGGVPGESPFNGVAEDEPTLTNVGLSASRTLDVSETLSLPVGVSFIFNPHTEDAFAVFSISLF
jgi:hypothetical protein